MKRDLSTVVEVLAAASLNQSTGKIAKNTGVPKTTVRRILSQAKAFNYAGQSEYENQSGDSLVRDLH